MYIDCKFNWGILTCIDDVLTLTYFHIITKFAYLNKVSSI